MDIKDLSQSYGIPLNIIIYIYILLAFLGMPCWRVIMSCLVNEAANWMCEECLLNSLV
jgi:hypothetical protein